MKQKIIDFKDGKISALFRQLFLPTLLGMIFSAVLIITDGIFVGKGLGSDALAAINIVSPLWLFSSGIGLMFGMGASVMASISLSRGKNLMACINTTQSIVFSTLFLLCCTVIVLIFKDTVLIGLGCSQRLMTPATDYLIGFVPFMAINALLCSTGFFVRLDGSPRYAMACNIIAAILNIVLDYLFIFPFNYGLFGAAIATSIGSIVGSVMLIIYLAIKKKNKHIHFVWLKMGKKHFVCAFRAVCRMSIIGFSSFLCELAVGCMMLCGNFVFISRLGEDGVAAFSIACYFFPIVFMLYNAIALSAQPIISYNYGINNTHRAKAAFRLSMITAVSFGLILTIITWLFSDSIVSLFISNIAPAHAIAASGLPLFALGFIPFAFSIASIGYYQSIEKNNIAVIITFLRGYAIMAISFAIIPILFGDYGIWLSIPVSEIITVIVVLLINFLEKKKSHKLTNL